ncbi:MAG: enoyl-CoA hydratase-related protein [Acidibacillus sp.]|uniref:Enoyl-CoA hydratase n=1 Tax=Sulfoacidibacillus ferrooxidans TaxID=2005001 RepID=A0A9X1V9C8_9BACL|nr:enoyl-CoA hydratase-related protein [Sulfoacidibacillus ferrooxidans]MCI0183259.1 putative enoyl-CoA hydratase [Sulfoacidibacillus ferrooxidans]MCY0893791.1 enoyl-CoA hydratase-related protein [Acidibacillus sp.]
MSELVRIDKEPGIAIVTIANPPMNVLSKAVAEGLLQAFRDLQGDVDVRVIVLAGEGERAFMAGADIKEFPTALGKVGMAYALAEQLHELMNLIDHMKKPTIAALHGFTFGGGLEMALTCDIRICDEGSLLGLPEIKLGIFPGAGGTQRLPRLIGEARAKEMMYTGEPIDAVKANQIGLVNRVVPKGQSLHAALELARVIAQRSLSALSLVKQAIDEGAELTLAQGLENEAKRFDDAFQTADSKEGIQAFIEKRNPVFNQR